MLLTKKGLHLAAPKPVINVLAAFIPRSIPVLSQYSPKALTYQITLLCVILVFVPDIPQSIISLGSWVRNSTKLNEVLIKNDLT